MDNMCFLSFIFGSKALQMNNISKNNIMGYNKIMTVIYGVAEKQGGIN